jgi:hypothetical protein
MDGAPGGKRQLSEAEVSRLSPQEKIKAMREGRLDRYLGKAG